MKHSYKEKVKYAANKYRCREQDIINAALFHFLGKKNHEKENDIFSYFTVEFGGNYAASWLYKIVKKNEQ